MRFERVRFSCCTSTDDPSLLKLRPRPKKGGESAKSRVRFHGLSFPLCVNWESVAQACKGLGQIKPIFHLRYYMQFYISIRALHKSPQHNKQKLPCYTLSYTAQDSHFVHRSLSQWPIFSTELNMYVCKDLSKKKKGLRSAGDWNALTPAIPEIKKASESPSLIVSERPVRYLQLANRASTLKRLDLFTTRESASTIRVSHRIQPTRALWLLNY